MFQDILYFKLPISNSTSTSFWGVLNSEVFPPLTEFEAPPPNANHMIFSPFPSGK